MEIKQLQLIGSRFCRIGLSAVAFLSGMAASAADAPVDKMEASTVRIIAKVDEGYSTGSGFVVGDGSYVVTNHHVIAGSSAIAVLAANLQVGVESLLVDDAQKDLAILKLKQNSGRPAVEFSLRANVHKTQDILAAGFPGAADDQGSDKDDMLEVKFTKGIISAFVRSKGGTNLYQVSAALNPGNSGGPLFDDCGHVVGINELKSLVEVVAMGEDGRPTRQRVPLGEGVAWSIQADELVPILQEKGIVPAIAASACGSETTSTPTGNPGVTQPTPRPSATASINRVVIWGAAALLVVALVVGFAVRMGSRPATAGGMQRGQMQGGQGMGQGQFPPLGTDLRLRGVSGPYAGKEFPVSAEPITLGRDPHLSQIVFDAQDSVVSKRHCTVRMDRASGGLYVEDCGSTNGTFLDTGERLRAGEPRLVRPYSSFYLGDRLHSFQVKS